MLRLSDALIERIVTRVEKGVPLETAVKAAGVRDDQVRQWGQVSQGASVLSDGTLVGDDDQRWLQEFMERIGQAQAEREATLVEGIGDAAATVGRSGVPEWRAGAWMLNNLEAYRQRYHEQRDVHVSGKVEHSLERQLVEATFAAGGLEALNALERQLDELTTGG